MTKKSEPAPETTEVLEDGTTPEWVRGWMPQRHVEIMAEIEKLKEEAAQMESLAQLLWQTGQPLEQSVRDIFRAVGLSAELTPGSKASDLTVDVGEGKRLLIVVAGTDAAITNKSPKIKQIFDASQEVADEGERIVMVANVHRLRPPADREWLDPLTGEAMMIIKGVSAVFVTTATLFAVWKLSQEHPQAAINHLLQLHLAESGPFTLDTAAISEPGTEGNGEGEDDGEESEESGGFATRLVSALKS